VIESPKAAPSSETTKRPAPTGNLKSLKQKLEKLDKSMAALSKEKAALETRLNGTLSVDEISETGKQLQHVIDELALEEGEWLALSEQIEVLETSSA
jgi:ATP-binding cassette subfamily F protein 3